jgi:phenylacetate-CoA ligase
LKKRLLKRSSGLNQMLTAIIDSVIERLPPKTLSSFMKRIPRYVSDRKRDAYFRRTVRYAYKKSPFYRRKFDELGINPRKVRSPKDLGVFYTTPQDIIDNAEEFLCRQPQIVFESSGTTGRNKRVYFGQDELDHIGRMNASGLMLGGITRNDRLVNAFDFEIWIPGIVTQKGLEKLGALGLVAGKIDPVEVHRRIGTYGFNVVLGEPTWLIKLTEIAEKKGSFPLKFIIAGGEAMPEAAKPWMEKIWQGAEVRMVYASVESGGIMAYEPFGNCKGYHIDENDFFVEIVNPDSDGYGEVAFTTLSRKTMPLIRYRNRDISKILEEPCACGVKFRRLAKMRGRTDEMVITAAGNLYPLMFDNILKDIDEITSDWQIIFRLKDIKEVMEFNLELKDPGARERVKQQIFSSIQALYPDIARNARLGIYETEFVYHAPGNLRNGNRKLVHIVDKRYTA